MSPSQFNLTDSGMGQDRHFFRVAIYGLEKGHVPEPDPEDVSHAPLTQCDVDVDDRMKELW
jgi:hypothetical protein